jgi:uncharacterized RDD family membrane protein YckC
LLPTGPVANKWSRVAARILDAMGAGTLVIATWWAFGDIYRIWTTLFLGFLAVWAYETISTLLFGATVGKRMLGLRVVTLDHDGRATPTTALRRGAASAALASVPVIGWTAWALSSFGDSLGRGIPDRAAASMVVPERFTQTVTMRALPGYADGARRPRLSTLGRVGDLDVRLRARLRRLTGSRLLAAAVGLLALAVSLPYGTGWLLLGSSAAWIVIFIGHETWLVHRTGSTPGHELAGLVIVDRRRGTAPGWVRSFARALVLGLTLYVPVLWPLLGVSMAMMRFASLGRGLHDLAGGTVVVADLRLDPEAQRQRSMRLRQGRVG